MFLDLTQAYPRLVKRAMVALIPLATSYVCESRFSALAIKTKQRNRLEVKDNMRVALSKTIPQFQVLVEKKQQPSHWSKLLKTNLFSTYFTSFLSCFKHFLSDCFFTSVFLSDSCESKGSAFSLL